MFLDDSRSCATLFRKRVSLRGISILQVLHGHNSKKTCPPHLHNVPKPFPPPYKHDSSRLAASSRPCRWLWHLTSGSRPGAFFKRACLFRRALRLPHHVHRPWRSPWGCYSVCTYRLRSPISTLLWTPHCCHSPTRRLSVGHKRLSTERTALLSAHN
jgi:hypothetical protein